MYSLIAIPIVALGIGAYSYKQYARRQREKRFVRNYLNYLGEGGKRTKTRRNKHK